MSISKMGRLIVSHNTNNIKLYEMAMPKVRQGTVDTNLGFDDKSCFN
jgi:hypothetical protein